ncbi:uncharacterized protein LOC144723638 isoform X2 [Lampetra planeri]
MNLILTSRLLVQQHSELHHSAWWIWMCWRLQGMRALPRRYPTGTRWTDADCAFRPITDDIIDGLTAPITKTEIAADPAWLTESTCLTTSNRDRAVVNAARAVHVAVATGRYVLRWRRRLKRDVPVSLQSLLYQEEDNPELFGYFVAGCPAQILDNGNSNVVYNVANGTLCTLVSVAWDDADERRATIGAKRAQSDSGDNGDNGVRRVIDVPTPPDHIIVSVHGVDVAASSQRCPTRC